MNIPERNKNVCAAKIKTSNEFLVYCPGCSKEVRSGSKCPKETKCEKK